MSVEVTPDDLRGAAGKLDPDSWIPSASVSRLDADLLGSSAGLSGTDTQKALVAARPACRAGMEVLHDRGLFWCTTLTSSAESYHATDVDAANALAALGDFTTGHLTR